MARLQMSVQFLLLVFAESTLGLDLSRLTVHEGPRAAGVFMVTEGGNYAFNFRDATATCQQLNVTIATKAQIEEALAHGLETCKFGWIAEQIAVVPRIAAVKTCGNDKTGVVPWHAKPQQRFGVFCFNASDSEETKSSTSVPRTATSSLSMFILLTQKPTTPVTPFTPFTPVTPVTPFTPVTPVTPVTPFTPVTPVTPVTPFTPVTPVTPVTPFTPVTPVTPVTPLTPVLRSSTEAQSATTATTERRRFFSTFTSTTRTTRATMLTFPPRLITPLPADVSLTLAVHTLTSSVSSASTVSSTRPQLGALSITLIVLCIVVLILTAGGAASYYKWSFFPLWPQRQKDDVETEMWKQTGSEMDLHIQHEQEEEEEEEGNRKYASDATLCLNPDLKTHC